MGLWTILQNKHFITRIKPHMVAMIHMAWMAQKKWNVTNLETGLHNQVVKVWNMGEVLIHPWIYPVGYPYLPFSCSIHFPLAAQTCFRVIHMWRTLGLTCPWRSFVLSKLVWDEIVGNKQILCKHWWYGGRLCGFPILVFLWASFSALFWSRLFLLQKPTTYSS